MPPKRSGGKPGKKAKPTAGPIDSAKSKIAEEEAQLKEQVAKYQLLIKQAPILAEQRKQAEAARKRAEEELRRLQREEAVVRRAKIEGRFGSPAALPDRRYELNAGAPAKQRRLRAERNRGRATFFLLLLIFLATLGFLYLTVTHSVR